MLYSSWQRYVFFHLFSRFNNNTRHSPVSAEHQGVGEGSNETKPATGWPQAVEGEVADRGADREGKRTCFRTVSFKVVVTTPGTAVGSPKYEISNCIE